MTVTEIKEKVTRQPLDDLKGWLNDQDYYPKLYIKSDREEIAVCGEIALKNQFPLNESSRFYGGMDFFFRGRKRPDWDSFDLCSFFLPALEVRKNAQETLLIQRDERPIKWESRKKEKSLPQILLKKELFTYPDYAKAVENILKKIDAKEVSKVVLARSLILHFLEHLDPFHLLDKISENSTHLFLYQLDPQKTFLGASPEILFHREKEKLTSCALAGSRKRGQTEEEDLQLEHELFKCAKERHEFNIVKQEIEKELKPFTSRLETSEISIIKTKNVQHLNTIFKGDLRVGVTDLDLLNALHPTPATGGYPRELALSMIYDLEPFDRGWYAAPIGYTSKEESHFLVGLRSALVKAKSLQLFGGSGLVKGSIPKKEWDEITNKMSQFLELFS